MPFRNLGANYGTQCAGQIKKWFHTCSQKHSDECNQPGSSILPKRLIYLENDPNVERLVLVDQLREPPQYVALSYCWGRKENFKTEPANLHEMEREIPHHRLPQTLEDVFYIVRQLDYRYLWIDALCIVQDQHGTEWKTEAAKMGDVYANASLVIAAMASPSVHDGLFVEMRDYPEEQKTEFHRIMRTCRTMTQKEWHGCINATYPLLCRAWAFQERLLARRIVHFTITELIWECAGDRWCECGDENNGGLSGNINNMNSALKDCRVNPTPTKTQLMWHECVKSFSRRSLTMLDDRLFAIDGIASYLRGPDPAAYNNLYFHGLWKDTLLWDLLWYCDQTSPLKREKSRSPSYSWSSVDCGIEWPACNHLRPEDKFSMAISTGTCFESRFKDRTATKSACFYNDTAVDSDALAIISRMTPVLIKLQNTSEQQNLAQKPSWIVENIKSRNSRTLPFYPDIRLENGDSWEGIVYHYVEIASSDDHSAVRQAGLIVRPRQTEHLGEQQEIYERVGMAGDISCNLEEDGRSWLTGEEMHRINP